VKCWYCYAKKIYQRFHSCKVGFEGNVRIIDEHIYLDLYYEFGFFTSSKKSKGVFVCSTFELFHPITLTRIEEYQNKYTWRDVIFHAIKNTADYRFYILTKLPQNIDRPMPPNVWLGTTITHGERRDISLKRTKANLKFISFEPFFGMPKKTYSKIIDERINWVIVGRLTGYGHKYDPKREWIEDIVNQARRFSIPVFLKNNLQEIWGESLIQEMPREIT